MMHRLDPQSEWDRRYKAHIKKQEQIAKPKVKAKPGPKKGQPMPKKPQSQKKAVLVSLGERVLHLLGTP